MDEDNFIINNIDKWRELEGFARRGKKKLSQYEREEIERFSALYREVSYHLSYAKSYYNKSNTTKYLNQLIAACHSLVYVREHATKNDVINYFTKLFPSSLKQFKWFICIAFLTFMLGAVISFVIVTANPENIDLYFSGMSNIDLKSPRVLNNALVSSQITTNNLRVAFLAFAFGVSCGIGTLYVLYVNGCAIGALYAFVIYLDESILHFWSLILPHGFFELIAIFICGGAGLLMGYGLLVPGELKRADAFIKNAKQGIMMMGGVVLMLLIAGAIEGFFTPLTISPYIKIVFAFITLILFTAYACFLPKDKDLLQ